MRKLTYEMRNGQRVAILTPIKEARGKITPMRQEMIERFGHVAKKFVPLCESGEE